MKTFREILVICSVCLLFGPNVIFAQNQVEVPEKEVRSPFRYVIVKDDIVYGGKNDEVATHRFIDVLMEEKAFNEANLIYLFKYLSGFYDEPMYLGIEVHTSLMTLETLEESTAMSTHSSREEFRSFHRMATYVRFNDGSEGFDYDIGSSPKFLRKSVNFSGTKEAH